MYEQVFHFSSRPFTATPFVTHYFSGDSIHQALGQAKICIDRASGPVTAVGAAGTGKSLLLAMLEHDYQSQFNVVNLACAKLEKRQDLLQSILFELKQPYQGLTDSELRFALIEYLSPSEQCANGILLLIDEAHLLSTEMLDEVRLITNFIRDGQPRVRLVMAGNQRLEENLTDPKLESFNQRIAARCYLSNMSQEETGRYVVEHVDRAGGEGRQLFNEASLKTIHEVSEGCPRLVNQVCDHALILAATRGELVITDACISEAWADVQNIPGDWAAPAIQQDSSSKLDGDESWTVIEFGQLDEDSDHQEDDGTVYDFASEEHQTEGADSRNEASGDDVLNNESSTGDDNAEWNPTDMDAEDVPADSVNLEPTGFSEGSQDGVEEQTADSFPSDVNDMEAQLNAVFGEEQGLAESSDEKGISELEAEQIELLDQVESAISNVDSAEYDPPVSEDGFGEAFESTAEEPDPKHSDSDPLEYEQEFRHEVTEELNVLDPTSQECLQEADIDACSQFDASAESQTDVEEESLTPLVNQWSEQDSGGQEDQPENGEHVVDASSGVQGCHATNESDDPFAEDFAEEEHLIDRYAPYVAHQNQSSLTITSSDLKMIRPLDCEPETESVNNSESQSGDVGEHDEPSESESSQSTETVLVTGEAFDGSDHGESAESGLRADENSTPGAIEISDEEASATPGVYVIEQEQPADLEPSVDLDSESTDQEPWPILTSPIDPASVMQFANEPLEVEPETDSNDADVEQSEIERQAELILKRLGVSPDVSCETDDSNLPHVDEAKDSPSSELESDVPRSSPQTILTENFDRPTPATQFSQASAETSEFDRQNAALDETQQILNEILAQKNLLAHQHVEPTVDGATLRSPVPTVEIPANWTPESPDENSALRVTEPTILQDFGSGEISDSVEIHADQRESPVDDREMIIVNKMDQPASEAPSDQSPIQFPETPISKGRAERMDYQQLFDQLRDNSNTDK